MYGVDQSREPPGVCEESYVAVGELESRELGPRSRVWSEPSMVWGQEEVQVRLNTSV